MNAKTKLLQKLHDAKLYEKMRLDKEAERTDTNEGYIADRKTRIRQCEGYMEAILDAMAITCD